jgi:NADH:ubiquinone oxidoreductase subunit 2 (subunit N)
MIESQSAPFILVLSIVLLALSGAITLAWGRKMPRNGDWFVGLFLLVLSGAIVFGGNGLVEEASKTQIWLRGWIWPVDREGALAAGVLQDFLGLILAGLGALMGALLLAGCQILPNQARPERTHSAIALAVAGCAMSWLALSPWLALAGLSLVVLGGFISLGSSWDSEEESELAIRFGRERAFGIILSVLGACALAGGHAPLLWSKAQHWIADPQAASFSEIIGAALLISGLLVQLQPFPLLSWTVSPGKTLPWIRVSLTQVFPAWATFGILLRLQSSLGEPIVFTVLGWVLLGSTFLAVISGTLQKRWEATLGAWFSAGASLAAAILCLSSAEPALALMIGLGLGATALACSQSLLVSNEDEDTEETQTVSGGMVIWAKTAAFLGVSAAIGVPGFISAKGQIEWLLQSWHDPAQTVAAISSFALFSILGWKLGWMVSRTSSKRLPQWTGLMIPTLLVLLALGIAWNGEVLGGALLGGGDRVAPSLMDLLFGAKPSGADESPTIIGAYLGTLLLSLGAAYWASLKTLTPESEGTVVSKVYRVILSGYRMDGLMKRATDSMTWASTQMDFFFDKRVMGEWIPKALTTAVRTTANAIIRVDSVVSVNGRKFVRQWIDSPAKLLQLIQNGDVQWYLLFGMGSGLVILAHYLFGAGMPH